MSLWPAISWQMCGGMPLEIASVMKIRRKSWGCMVSGCPAPSVIPAAARAFSRNSRTALYGIGRFSTPKRRWNSSGTVASSNFRSWRS